MLSNLDSKNPVLYLEFPGCGRLKLFGTLLFPTNKYMVLRLPSRSSEKGGGVVCEDVFESMVRFGVVGGMASRARAEDSVTLLGPPCLFGIYS